MSIPESVRQTMYHTENNHPDEFRGPVCGAWDRYWIKIARADSISSDGRIFASLRQIAQVYNGKVIGHREIFGKEQKFGERLVIVKNHLAADNLDELIGVRNGMVSIDNLALTVEIVGKTFFALRAANINGQSEFVSFYNQVTATIDRKKIPSL